MGGRIDTQILERGFGNAAAAHLWLFVNFDCFIERDGKDLIFRGERSGVGAMCHVRAIATILHGDVNAFIFTEVSWERK